MRAQVVKFYKGGDIKYDRFRNEKPTTEVPTTLGPRCKISDLEIPEELKTEMNGFADAGETVSIVCNDDSKVWKAE